MSEVSPIIGWTVMGLCIDFQIPQMINPNNIFWLHQQEKVCLTQRNISISTRFIGSNLCTDIHASQKMNLKYTSNYLTFQGFPLKNKVAFCKYFG